MRLRDKVALITGAGSGIGRAAARRFAEEGAAVVVVDRDAPTADETVELVVESGGRAAAVTADVSRSEDCATMVAFAEATFGRLDVLFNNAGVMVPGDDDAVSTEESLWDLTMAVNAKGVFLGCKHGIPALRRAGGGSIINTASFVALMGAATPQLAYTASKGAVLSLSRELAVIHAREGIRVNALCPGPLRTEMLMTFLDTEAKRQRRLVHIPIGRFGEADEVAEAALFLASDEASFITGTDFLVDGGITAAYVTPGVSRMRVGLLECDHVSDRYVAIAGDYADMFAAVLAGVGPELELVRYDARRGVLPQRPDECDGWLCTGSSASVYDDEPWIHALADVVRHAHAARVPFVGVCFGHQLLAHALGGRTARAAVGWGVGALAMEVADGAPAWLQPWRASATLLYSHEDQVTGLPPGGRILASAVHCPVAMLAVDDDAVGLQAHPEFTPDYLRALLSDRVDRIGEAGTAAALASLARPTDERDVAAWIVAFLRARAGTRPRDLAP